MHAGTIALVLVAAVAHAVWNTASKYKRGNTVRFVWTYTAASAVLCLPAAATFVVRGGQRIDLLFAVAALLSAVLHVAYSMTLQSGYDRAELGVVYPVARGSGPILTMVCAVLFLGERLALVEVVGALVIVAGVGIVAGNPFANGRRDPLRGVGWGAATGATIAAYTLWDAYAVTGLHVEPLVYFAATLLFEALLLAPRALRTAGGTFDAVRTNPVVVPIIAVFSPLAYILVLFAMQHAPVAVVAPLRESSIVLASFLAWRLFGEDHLPRRIVGAVVVLGGIVAVSV